MFRRRFRSLVVLAFILFPAALILTLSLLYSQNSLYVNGEWIAEKRMAQMAVMSADEFLLTRMPLSQNLLNLGAYFGNQQVEFRGTREPSEVRFKFQIPENSYLDFTFNGVDGRYDAIRIPGPGGFAALYYESTAEGKFLKKNAIALPSLSADWHEAVVRNSEIAIDGGAPVSVPAKIEKGSVGFRAGLSGAVIKRMDVRTAGNETIRADFVNGKRWFAVLILNLFALACLGGLVCRGNFFAWITFALVTAVMAGSWYVFDFYYYSRFFQMRNGITHFLLPDRLSSRLPDFEEVRVKFSGFWYGLAGGEKISEEGIAARGYPAKRIWAGPIYCGSDGRCDAAEKSDFVEGGSELAPYYRVMLIGSSQSVGSGAWHLEETFFARLHRSLRASLPKSVGLESLNISQSGATSDVLLEEYKLHYVDKRPDLVVVNLANNDVDSKKFAESMNELVALNDRYKIKTVLIKEANNPERDWDPDHVIANYKTLDRLGDDFDLPVYSMADFLKDPARITSGNIWWDFIHLTSYGQELIADWLSPKILTLLVSDPAKARAPLKIKKGL